jgi:chromosome partitioning protein
MTTLTVFNQKGGVGKTTTALNLSAALERRGRAPVGIDLDPQAQFGGILGVPARTGDDSIFSVFQRNRPLQEIIKATASGIRIIPSHAELSKVDAIYGKGYNALNKLNLSLHAEKSNNNIDSQTPCVIDCCPMVGVLSLNAIFASDSLIIPISADHLSFKGAIQIQKTLKALEQVLKRRVNRRYLLTRFDSRRRMAREILLMAEKEFGADVCKTLIFENVSLAESPAMGKTIFEHAPHSNGARNYDALLDELMKTGFIE